MKRPLVAAIQTRRCVNANSRCSIAHASKVSSAVSRLRNVSSARWEPASSAALPLAGMALTFILQMGFEEPQILVEFAGAAGEQTLGAGIAESRRVVDGCAHRL